MEIARKIGERDEELALAYMTEAIEAKGAQLCRDDLWMFNNRGIVCAPGKMEGSVDNYVKALPLGPGDCRASLQYRRGLRRWSGLRQGLGLFSEKPSGPIREYCARPRPCPTTSPWPCTVPTRPARPGIPGHGPGSRSVLRTREKALAALSERVGESLLDAPGRFCIRECILRRRSDFMGFGTRIGTHSPVFQDAGVRQRLRPDRQPRGRAPAIAMGEWRARSAARLSGVGADGLIFLDGRRKAPGRLHLAFLQLDGSRAEMLRQRVAVRGQAGTISSGWRRPSMSWAPTPGTSRPRSFRYESGPGAPGPSPRGAPGHGLVLEGMTVPFHFVDTGVPTPCRGRRLWPIWTWPGSDGACAITRNSPRPGPM